MIVAQNIIDEIRYRKRRTLDVPFVRGEFGETRPCTIKVNRTLTLTPPGTATRARDITRAARNMPSRKHAIVWLAHQLENASEVARKPVKVTVNGVHRDQNREVWVITFLLGEVELVERERLLAADPGSSMADYVETPARAANHEGAPVPEPYQVRLSDEGRERDKERRDGLEREMKGVIARYRQSFPDPHVESNLRSIERQAAALHRKVDRKAA